MKYDRIAKRYAKALILLSNQDIKVAEQRKEALNVVNQLFDLKQITKILVSPVVSKEVKKEVVLHVVDKVAKDDNLLKYFFDFVIDEGRINHIPGIVWSYSKLLDEWQGISDVSIVFAQEPSDSAVSTIINLVKQKLHKELRVSKTVDSSILGGFVLKLENAKVDLSLKTELEELTTYAAL